MRPAPRRVPSRPSVPTAPRRLLTARRRFPSTGLVPALAAALAAGLFSALVPALIPAPLHGQVAEAPVVRPDDPAMPEAPPRFSLLLGAGVWRWDAAPAGTGSVDDATGLALELETRLTPWLAFRLGGGLAAPSIEGTGAEAGDRLDADQYHVEVDAVLRAPWPLARWRVTPYMLGGVGSVIHDPDRDGLGTRNQSLWTVGAGAEWDALERVGVRFDWRHAQVELGDIFDPLERDSATVGADRWSLGAYWRF
ncbi:MAG: porin family protein [Longimicrobiales bacterium]|nr:porin family protein [Longimicrobiales bacterium]